MCSVVFRRIFSPSIVAIKSFLIKIFNEKTSSLSDFFEILHIFLRSPLAKRRRRSRIFIAVPMGDLGADGLAAALRGEIPLDGGLPGR